MTNVKYIFVFVLLLLGTRSYNQTLDTMSYEEIIINKEKIETPVQTKLHQEFFIFNNYTSSQEEYNEAVIKILNNTEKQINIKPEEIRLESDEKSIIIDRVELDKSDVDTSNNLNIKHRKRTILGPSQFDSRIETTSLNPDVEWQNKILENAQSVGIIVEKTKLSLLSDDYYLLDINTSLKERYNLCNGEAYADQPTIGVGTAFIIGENEMLTAGHVFIDGAIENYAVVFGFKVINKTGTFEILIPKQNIYFPKNIVQTDIHLDITRFSTDRRITRPALKYSREKQAKKNLPVFMIGFPMGLPQKVALNASISKDEHSQYFYTTLDAFQGNSGSPVFNSETNEVIGVLVSGEVDFKWNGVCNTSTICKPPYCDGEKVIRIEKIIIN